MFERSPQERKFYRGLYFPAGFAAGVWFLLNFLTNHLEWFGNGAGYRTAAFFLYLLLGLSIFFSGPVVYGLMYVRGASLMQRLLGAYLVPLAWALKEIWRVSEFFTMGESLYYSLSPLPLGVLTYQVGFLSLVEIFFRWRKKKSEGFSHVLSRGPIVGLVFFALILYLTLLWGVPGESPGTRWFYLYQEGYKMLFGYVTRS